MKIVEQLRTRLHEQLLRKELTTLSRKRSSMYLDNAATVGILFDGTQPEDRETVLAFSEKLRSEGKKVKLLAFFDSNLKSQHFTFPHFNRQHLDYALRPKTPASMEFAAQSFDLLLNLTKKTVLPLDYIAARSCARFRVGPYTDITDCYDLMIDLPAQDDLYAFLHQVVHYLKRMRVTAGSSC
jgi:hypothetical protein